MTSCGRCGLTIASSIGESIVVVEVGGGMPAGSNFFPTTFSTMGVAATASLAVGAAEAAARARLFRRQVKIVKPLANKIATGITTPAMMVALVP